MASELTYPKLKIANGNFVVDVVDLQELPISEIDVRQWVEGHHSGTAQVIATFVCKIDKNLT